MISRKADAGTRDDHMEVLKQNTRIPSLQSAKDGHVENASADKPVIRKPGVVQSGPEIELVSSSP